MLARTDEVEDVARLARAGMCVHQIMARTGHSHRWVERRLAIAGIKPVRRNTYPGAVKLYERKVTISIDEEMYQILHRVADPRQVSELIRTFVEWGLEAVERDEPEKFSAAAARARRRARKAA